MRLKVIGFFRGALRRPAILLLFSFGIFSAAQAPFPAPIGNSVVQLTGPWKFQPGDNPAWAQPDFDDSAWATMDLTPPRGSYDPTMDVSGFIPGWTARGYPHLHGYAWYRLRVKIENNAASRQDSALALKMPFNIDDAYQVFVDGRKIGEFGRFSPHRVVIYNTVPLIFAMPADKSSGAIVIAIRMWMDASTPLFNQDVGGMHGPPMLGQAPAIQSQLRLDWDDIDRSEATGFVGMALLLLAVLLAVVLFWLDRGEQAYLWLALACIARLIVLALNMIGWYSNWLPILPEIFCSDVVMMALGMALWIVFWGYWFRLDRMALLHRITWSLALLLMLAMATVRWPLYGSVIPVQASAWLTPLTVVLKLALGVVLVWVTWRGIRLRGAEGWLALPAVILLIVRLYQEELNVLHIPINYRIFGLVFSIGDISNIFLLFIVSVLLMRRFIHGQREQVEMRTEIEQARQVQQLLVPEATPAVPGFRVESEYRPAQQVGGDFFQIIPGADGSILVVLGDVSGKGLKAAMLVSMIVGAMRMISDSTRDPLELLSAINRRLAGRLNDQFATCLALYVAPTGEVTLANAGHLPPYLNGREVTIAGSVPLGVIASADFHCARFTLHPGDRLVLLTDGVVEARNQQGDLLGFDRTADLVAQNISAVAIATAAQSFGQEDDITVLQVERLAAA